MPQQSRYEALHPELDVKQLIQSARVEAGLSDFGDESFFAPMEKLLDCAARDVDFHEQGLGSFRFDVVRCLVNRLRMQDDIKRHPEILDEDVSDPIIITGLGRSGTTKLHKMLSTPDDVQKTYFWRMWNPARFPDAVPGKLDPRIAAADFSDLISEDKPGVDAAHHIEQGEVEEESMLYFFTFENWAWCQIAPTFSFHDWVMEQPGNRPYRFVKTMLQYLQWQDGGRVGNRVGNRGDRPWILKAPFHLPYIDTLLDCYPNATVVHTHRDPRQTMPSWTKFICNLWLIQSNPVDPLVAGKELLHSWSQAMMRYLEKRDRLKLDNRIVDVKYEHIRNDPMSVVKEIYRRTGREMSADAEQKMAAWHESNEQGRFGRHEYSLQEFGLTEQMIDDSFSDYINRFIYRGSSPPLFAGVAGVA